MVKLAHKNVTKEDISKLLLLTEEDIQVTCPDELMAMVALLTKRNADISSESHRLMESSGLNELDNESDSIKSMIKRINSALLSAGSVSGTARVVGENP